MEELTTSKPLPRNSIKNIWINFLLKYKVINKIQLNPVTKEPIDYAPSLASVFLILSGTVISSWYLSKKFFEWIDQSKE